MKRWSLRGITMVTVAGMCAYCGADTSRAPTSWLIPVDGRFTVGGNWDTGVSPTLNDTALLGRSGPYTVTIDAPASAGSLAITNPSVLLQIEASQTLQLWGDLYNLGQVMVNPMGEAVNSGIEFMNHATLGGSGSLLLGGEGTAAQLRTLGAAVLTQSSGHTVMGQGQIEASFVNEGLVRANEPLHMLRLNTNDKANHAMMEAVNGGRLVVERITLTQGPFGILAAGNVGSRIDIDSAVIINGRVQTTENGVVRVYGSTLLQDTQLAGEVGLMRNSELGIQGGLINDGLIGIGDYATLKFEQGASLSGEGIIRLGSLTFGSIMETVDDAELTIPFGQLVDGSGLIEGNFINEGVVRATIQPRTLMIRGAFLNRHEVRVAERSRLTISNTTLVQDSDAMIIGEELGSVIRFENTTIDGGSVLVHPEGLMRFAGSCELHDVLLSGSAVTDSNTEITIYPGTVLDAQLSIRAPVGGQTIPLRWSQSMTLEGSGTISLESINGRAQLRGDTGVLGGLGDGIRLEGNGEVDIELLHAGILAPGNGVGTMTATEPVRLTPTSRFEAEVDAVQADLFESNTEVEIAGLLEIRFVNGFDPSGFWVRKIIEGDKILGAFSTFVAPPAPGGRILRIRNTGEELFVGQTCVADLNLDGVLNIEDVLVFYVAYTTQDRGADLTGDGEFNFYDVSAFLIEYQSGCEP